VYDVLRAGEKEVCFYVRNVRVNRRVPILLAGGSGFEPNSLQAESISALTTTPSPRLGVILYIRFGLDESHLLIKLLRKVLY
jgi:hypothetical protein